MLIDTHCHLQFKGMDADREAIAKRCKDKGIILNIVGTQKNTSLRAVELAVLNKNMYASIGTHPSHLFPAHIDEEESHFTSREEDFDIDYYEELYNRAPDKIIGVGETGLDLYHLPDDVPIDAVIKKQKDIFIKHVEFAISHDLPLVIHVREAHEQMIGLLKTLQRPVKGVVHCYTANWEYAREYLNLGLYIGFTGVVTFPPKKLNPEPQIELLNVMKKMPLEKILVETDAPYLAPQAYRGQICEPWMVEEVVKKISQTREQELEIVRAAVCENAMRLFDKIKLNL